MVGSTKGGIPNFVTRVESDRSSKYLMCLAEEHDNSVKAHNNTGT